MNELRTEEAFWIDGEWIGWDGMPLREEEHPSRLAFLEWQDQVRQEYPKAEIALVPYFDHLLELAASHFEQFRRHLQVYGEIGELYGAIQYGITLNKPLAQGSDGRLGNDLVEIKTIAPHNRKQATTINLDRNFGKLLVVRIGADFEIEDRMICRKDLPKRSGGSYRLSWKKACSIS